MENTPATQPTAAEIARQLVEAADNAPSFGGLKQAAQQVAGFAVAVSANVEEVDAVNREILDKLPLLLARIDALEKAIADGAA